MNNEIRELLENIKASADRPIPTKKRFMLVAFQERCSFIFGLVNQALALLKQEPACSYPMLCPDCEYRNSDKCKEPRAKSQEPCSLCGGSNEICCICNTPWEDCHHHYSKSDCPACTESQEPDHTPEWQIHLECKTKEDFYTKLRLLIPPDLFERTRITEPDHTPETTIFTRNFRGYMEHLDSSCEDTISGLIEYGTLACKAIERHQASLEVAEKEIKTFADWRERLRQQALQDNATVKYDRKKCEEAEKELEQRLGIIREQEGIIKRWGKEIKQLTKRAERAEKKAKHLDKCMDVAAEYDDKKDDKIKQLQADLKVAEAVKDYGKNS